MNVRRFFYFGEERLFVLLFFAEEKQNDFYFSASFRGVAQPGLEYTSGGRVVAGSNPVTPTKTRSPDTVRTFFMAGEPSPRLERNGQKKGRAAAAAGLRVACPPSSQIGSPQVTQSPRQKHEVLTPSGLFLWPVSWATVQMIYSNLSKGHCEILETVTFFVQ